MKIWTQITEGKKHKIVRFNCEEHSDMNYVGEFDDTAFKEYLQKLDGSIDVEKNLKLIKYYGYLHLFLSEKKQH